MSLESGNTNLNSTGSNYASQFGHGTTDMIKRVQVGRIKNAAPKQFYVDDVMEKVKRKRKNK